VDHVVPRRLGGNDSDENLVASCRRCNLSKGGRFFVSQRTPPTPAMFFSPKGLKSPFEKPKVN
jgi:5-methylcytosine-specific restriction endonuclease McrA